MAEVLIVIPARHASHRFPGKPLVALRGAGGVAATLLERTWRAGMAVPDVARVVVATDDARIADAAHGFGADVVMTGDCANGTERCAQALDRLGTSPDVVVNVQGDAPLTPPWFVTPLIDAVLAGAPVATPVLRLTADMHGRFLADRHAGLVGGTTAVMDASGRALYFSKEVLPWTGRTYGPGERVPVFHHVGVYAYTPAALAAYRAAGPCDLELLEGLEQLRFLHNGIPVACVEVDARGRQFWEVNNPADVARVEAVLAAEGIA